MSQLGLNELDGRNRVSQLGLTYLDQRDLVPLYYGDPCSQLGLKNLSPS